MSRPAVLAALVGVALASSLPGEEVLKGRDKLFIQHIARVPLWLLVGLSG